uniref:Uncharacterized protein n=1 Tax=Salix viminalis TaxID=40686 RepID=A0A6N2L4Q5_SALVM
MKFCRSEEQLTNILIEALSKDIFNQLRLKLGRKKEFLTSRTITMILSTMQAVLLQRGKHWKKRHDEVAEEEIQIREDAEDLRTQLISRKDELETYMKALPEDSRQQNEAENRANNSNDQWEGHVYWLKDIFSIKMAKASVQQLVQIINKLFPDTMDGPNRVAY